MLLWSVGGSAGSLEADAAGFFMDLVFGEASDATLLERWDCS